MLLQLINTKYFQVLLASDSYCGKPEKIRIGLFKGVRHNPKSEFSQNRLLAILWIIWILFIFRINNLNHMILSGLEYRLAYKNSRQLIWLEQ